MPLAFPHGLERFHSIAFPSVAFEAVKADCLEGVSATLRVFTFLVLISCLTGTTQRFLCPCAGSDYSLNEVFQNAQRSNAPESRTQAECSIHQIISPLLPLAVSHA